MKHYLALTICLVVPVALAQAANAPPPCPPSYGRVERSQGPAWIYLSRESVNPEICLMDRGDGVGRYYFGTWRVDWPGAEGMYWALKQVYAGPPGTVVRFDTVVGPGFQWHETIRNDGFENLHVLNGFYPTMKVTREREGFGGNTYHSIITQWKEVASGMTIYQNYIHISGAPERGTSWDPNSILGGR